MVSERRHDVELIYQLPQIIVDISIKKRSRVKRVNFKFRISNQAASLPVEKYHRTNNKTQFGTIFRNNRTWNRGMKWISTIHVTLNIRTEFRF